MPIYEFRCRKCGKVFEQLCRMSDPNPACRECGAQVEKMFSRFGFTSGGRTVTGTGAHDCSSCGSHNCSTCGH